MDRIKHKGKLRPLYDKYRTSEPQPPWSVRRIRWLRKILAETERLQGFAKGMIVNTGGFSKTNTNEKSAGELRRLIKEGYAVLSLEQTRPWGSRRLKNARWLTVTEAGLKLLEKK